MWERETLSAAESAGERRSQEINNSVFCARVQLAPTAGRPIPLETSLLPVATGWENCGIKLRSGNDEGGAHSYEVGLAQAVRV
jgi:hypothetical protein